MLSSPSANRQQATMPTIAQRRREHRRQISTPSAIESVTPQRQRNPPPSTTGRPAGAGHRRGLSLDTRRQHIRNRSTASAASVATPAPAPVGGDGAGDFDLVSMTTNTALTGTPQRDVPREAQPHCSQAGPGSHANAQHFSFPATGQQVGGGTGNYNYSYNGHEDYVVSPHGNPQAPSYGQSFGQGSFDMFAAMEARANMANAMASNPSYFQAGSALSTPTYTEFPEALGFSQGSMSEGETAGARRTTRRISNGIQDRVSKFETLTDERQRAVTPPNQNANDCLSTRQVQASGVKQEERPSRFDEGYDESMEETIKPGRKTSPRGSTVFDDMRQQAEQAQPMRHQPIAPAPGPQRSHTMPSTMGHMSMPSGDYLNMNQFSNEFMKIRADYHDGMGNPLSATNSVPYDPLPDLRPHDSISQPTSPERRSHHRRTDSVASLKSAASISTINIEETRTATGVTLDDIATHIRGPDAADGKWECLFDGCGKRFGRKENIKSHVQTHLNDRQYQCPSCAKCFVRQHDLKRHAKIHTGVKAYDCPCGNSFARHDALTRHRQRGMCVGAFDGVVRKVVKRGRPRKHRPDMDERVDKASRTRKKNLSVSSVSSAGGYSDASSGPVSPQNGFNGAEDDFDAMDLAFDMAVLRGLPPAPRAPAGAELQGYAHSPESASAHSYVSPGAIMDPGHGLPPQPTSPARSAASHYAEPPELSQSSSPPPCHLFDSDAAQPADGMASAFPTASQHQSLPAALLGGLGDHDEDVMKAFTHGEELVPVEGGAGMFAVSKFDEEFAASMMGADDHLFFN